MTPNALTLPPPAWRTCPPYTKTYGPEVVDLAASAGLALDEVQGALLDDWFSVRPDSDLWNVSEGAIICPRQNLKTVTLEAAALAKLYLFRDRLVTWTAHLYDTAREAFLELKPLIDNHDHLRREVKSISVARGDESIELTTGERLEFLARTSHGGRGMSGDTMILDEALKLQPAHMGALVPTLSARRGSQILYGSSAGDGPAAVLRALRDRGRAGQKRLAYTEYAAPRVECEQEHCSHQPDMPGCALDRLDLLLGANPALALPGRLQLEFIRDTERLAVPPAEYMRERFGWWDEPRADEAAISAGAWVAAGDVASTIDGPTEMAIAMRPDRAVVTLAAAGFRHDGLLHVEVVRHGPAGDWFVPAVASLAARNNAAVTLHPGHAAGSLLPDLEKAGVRVKQTNSSVYAQACGAMYDAIHEHRLRYPAPQPELSTAVEQATRKFVGESSWRWAGEDITALVAATQALYAVLTRPRGGKGRVIGLA